MSIQEVFKCSEMLSSAIPWMGHTNKQCHGHQIKKSSHTNPVGDADVTADNSVSPINAQTKTKKTRCGRQV